MEIWKRSVLFYLGGCAYMAMELAFRGRTDGSMFVAGGLCFLLLGMLNRLYPRLPLLLRGLIGAAVITAVELGIGLMVNRDYHVWDYRGQPGNFLGQICPQFTLLWIPVGLLAMYLHEVMDKQLTGQLRRPVNLYFIA